MLTIHLYFIVNHNYLERTDTASTRKHLN